VASPRKTAVASIASLLLLFGGCATSKLIDTVGSDARGSCSPDPGKSVTPGSGGIYVSSTGPWSTLPPSPLAGRAYNSAVWTGGELITWGGAANGGFFQFADGAAYDPKTAEWRVLAQSPLAPRDLHTAVWTGEEMIVWGGLERDSGTEFGDGAAYDPSKDCWRMLSGSPIDARAEHASVWTGREMIVWGGTSSDFLSDGAPTIHPRIAGDSCPRLR